MWVRHMRKCVFWVRLEKRGGGRERQRVNKKELVSERDFVCVHVFWQITWVPLHDETHRHKLRLSSVPLVKLRGLTYSCNCCYDWPNVQLSTNESTDMLLHSCWPLRVTLIAKFCVNIAFFQCHTHFSHIAASPYAKWQHQLNRLWLTGIRSITQH